MNIFWPRKNWHTEMIRMAFHERRKYKSPFCVLEVYGRRCIDQRWKVRATSWILPLNLEACNADVSKRFFRLPVIRVVSYQRQKAAGRAIKYSHLYRVTDHERTIFMKWVFHVMRSRLLIQYRCFHTVCVFVWKFYIPETCSLYRCLMFQFAFQIWRLR